MTHGRLRLDSLDLLIGTEKIIRHIRIQDILISNGSGLFCQHTVLGDSTLERE